jgi:3-deoxy-7-phosphoheptulonate synthase/chorismate mutase
VIEDQEIDELRRQIDAIDLQLLTLLAKRHEVVLAVGERKRLQNLPVYDPKREAAQLERLGALAPPPVDGETIRAVFSAIMQESRRLQEQHIRRASERPPEP